MIAPLRITCSKVITLLLENLTCLVLYFLCENIYPYVANSSPENHMHLDIKNQQKYFVLNEKFFYNVLPTQCIKNNKI